MAVDLSQNCSGSCNIYVYTPTWLHSVETHKKYTINKVNNTSRSGISYMYTIELGNYHDISLRTHHMQMKTPTEFLSNYCRYRVFLVKRSVKSLLKFIYLLALTRIYRGKTLCRVIFKYGGRCSIDRQPFCSWL